MRFAPFLRGSAAILALSVLAAGTASAQILWDNGPAVDANNLSVIRPNGVIFGVAAQGNIPNIVADNFTVGSAWSVSGLSFFSYQSFANSQYTFTNVIWSMVSGDVNAGAVVASGSMAPSNGGLQGYRVYTELGNTDRAIFQLDLDVADFGLGVGNYWLRWSIEGSTLVTGPWQPPTSDGAFGNAVQSVTNGPFNQIIDTDDQGVELPFLIRGTTATVVPEPSTWAMMLVGGAGLFGMARRRKVTE